MAARHYAQILDATTGAQSATDDLRFAAAPAAILGGKFRLGYIPRFDSSLTSQRTLLAVRTAVNKELAFAIGLDGSDLSVLVYHTDAGGYVAHGPITFSVGKELTLIFDAEAGKVTLTGADTGDGNTIGTPWDYPVSNPGFNDMRLGGSFVLGFETAIARGYVSLPYAVI